MFVFAWSANELPNTIVIVVNILNNVPAFVRFLFQPKHNHLYKAACQYKNKHTWVYEWLSTPPALDIDDKEHASQQQERQTAHTHDIGQRPEETNHRQHFTTTATFYSAHLGITKIWAEWCEKQCKHTQSINLLQINNTQSLSYKLWGSLLDLSIASAYGSLACASWSCAS